MNVATAKKTKYLKPNISNKKSIMQILKKYSPFYIMFLPVFIYYVVFQYLPMLGIVIAFKDYSFLNGLMDSKWVGLKHFIRFINNGDFWMVFKNTIIISFLRIVFGFPAPVIFALMLNEVRAIKFKKFIQTVSYMPHFISWVVMSGLLYSFFSGNGLINNIITALGGKVISFLSDGDYFRIFLVGTAIWKEVGWSAIIYLAALSGIDEQLYEAADIDGAGRMQQLWNITLPSIRNVVSIMLVLSFANVLNAGFEQVLVMINPTVVSVGEIIDYYIFRVGLLQVSNYSYASAVGLFKSLFCLILVLVTNWGAKKISEEGAIW